MIPQRHGVWPLFVHAFFTFIFVIIAAADAARAMSKLFKRFDVANRRQITPADSDTVGLLAHLRVTPTTLFYRAVICIARTMPSQDVCLSVRLSVCLSVTRRYCIETKHFSAFNARHIITYLTVSYMLFPETVEVLLIVLEGYKNKLLHWTVEISVFFLYSALHKLAAYCVLSTVYCFMNFVVVKPVSHGSCIMGHRWVNFCVGQWVMGHA